ncbi:coiled-coil domain-containing protein [Paraglaciecola arctica]|uniref:Rad50/SbcC-type AAA domain-containing protein n=1 Tax=Paraglaciecola arctica BSs20135 TaxID=493475 RepID=K6XGF0_9ALTE|nr:hypothetical protein [Paraglaciecola arctica]GAC19729.1 hypothetical protein GARC_2764 [Paraglaciecola arctica BSs20135]
MKIKEFAFGNISEAFVENRFGERLNIIFSNDNNKGKTLVIQGLMFALGNEAIFPAGFDFNNYYFYLKLEANSKTFSIMRKKNTFIVIEDEHFHILESVSEFKYFFDKLIFPLPQIVHKGLPKLVDLHLFYQLFFVGQDKRDTSAIFNSGYYNKADFIQMLYSFRDISGKEIDSEKLSELKSNLANLRRSETKLLKEMDRFKINKVVLENVKVSAAYRDYQEQQDKLEKTNNLLANLKNNRNRENSRRNGHFRLQSELNSLNRTIEFGKVSCDDCGSTNIKYSSKDVAFDISNKQIRQSILRSIEMNIQIKDETISKLDYEIDTLQGKFDKELSSVKPELRDIIFFRDELEQAGSLDQELVTIQKNISITKDLIVSSSNANEGISNKQKQLITDIVNSMNEIYRVIDKNGIQVFEDLFTKRGVNYSGSEEQEFYFAKLYALHNVLKHPFPIVIDSFRDRELSTKKELEMLDILERLDTQIIITSTLKQEEYIEDKYESYKTSVAIDYSNHQDSHILNSNHLPSFIEICNSFNISDL